MTGKHDGKMAAHMERLRRLIAAQLQAGSSLTSPKVLALSRRLDRLVLDCYRTS
jgi:hypothetical protein